MIPPLPLLRPEDIYMATLLTDLRKENLTYINNMFAACGFTLSADKSLPFFYGCKNLFYWVCI